MRPAPPSRAPSPSSSEGMAYIRANRAIGWSLDLPRESLPRSSGSSACSGPDFAEDTLGLGPEDLFVVVLPLGIGIVMGVLLLNSYGRYVPRRRAIEGGLIALGVLLAAMTAAGPLSRALQGVKAPLVDLSAVTSLIAVVIAMAFVAGIAYGIVAISSQTQLQEDLPRGGSRPGLRRPQHARLGRELPADHHRRPDLGPRRDDGGDPDRGRRGLPVRPRLHRPAGAPGAGRGAGDRRDDGPGYRRRPDRRRDANRGRAPADA